MRSGKQHRHQSPGGQEDLLLLHQHRHVLHPDPADDRLLLHDRGQALLQLKSGRAAGGSHASGEVNVADVVLLYLYVMSICTYMTL